MSSATREARGGGAEGGDLDDVALLHFLGSLLRFPPRDRNPSPFDPLLDLRARRLGQIRQVAQEDVVEALADVAPVGADRPDRPRRVAHAGFGAGGIRRRSAKIASPARTPQSAMNCEVDITPRTWPRGSPRKNSIVPRRSA